VGGVGESWLLLPLFLMPQTGVRLGQESRHWQQILFVEDVGVGPRLLVRSPIRSFGDDK